MSKPKYSVGVSPALKTPEEIFDRFIIGSTSSGKDIVLNVEDSVDLHRKWNLKDHTEAYKLISERMDQVVKQSMSYDIPELQVIVQAYHTAGAVHLAYIESEQDQSAVAGA